MMDLIIKLGLFLTMCTVVSTEAYSQITDTNLSTPVKYTSFINNLSNYYHTLPMPAGAYPCSNGLINALLIGSQKNCPGDTFCNGPLKNDTYRVKFILLSSTGIFNQTQWSDTILVPKLEVFREKVEPEGRSRGMIVLTSILSVLLAILVISLIAALAIGSRDICWKQTLNYDVGVYGNFDHLTRGTYRTHYEHFTSSSFRGRKPLSEDM
ncbi:uroplakin-3b-like protein 1 isoform X2 [Rana temporaria]|uniref:uroplakin-3b-like protein 1 isoform X2 n=1 Tax=Rana temporaria TaxID=8407 RepID=UPI001AAC79E5|nr:uroplakin-3b-like protein 1 isoform X2 [Rana temporaria]